MTGTRTSRAGHTQWPRVLVFPGQAGAVPGPVDMTVMYLMHHAFRRDLSAFVRAAQRTPVSDRATWSALAERWGLFAHVLHHHHSGEDAGLWPLLMQRADESGRLVLAAMEAEHAEIDPILTACAEGFTRLAGHEDADARAALAVRLVAARESLGRHLAHEETEGIALVQQHLTQDEWLAVEDEHFRTGLSFTDVVRLVPWVAHEVPAELRDEAFALGSPLQKIVWRLTRRSFERRERMAFGYVA